MCIKKGYPIQVAEENIKVYRIHYINKVTLTEMSPLFNVDIKTILNNKPEHVSTIRVCNSYSAYTKQNYVFNNSDDVGFHSFKRLKDACKATVQIMREKHVFKSNFRWKYMKNNIDKIYNMLHRIRVVDLEKYVTEPIDFFIVIRPMKIPKGTRYIYAPLEPKTYGHPAIAYKSEKIEAI